ncbi:AraC family transcriptional regulator [Paenibacillus sacheonensis]|uniref:Helix-turn-helix domain-containing protein n=1 Tax=Paenibacillus sacheonensis TaxID=742054 RepID=A0A7X5C3M1_9BACL|nr:AraC family transcriptional regulator [Paenibacillus sacheonensis]NBC72480.1 helix-turn-helix domain-containing protein [Paenibacillus sacheonensis]
MRLEDHAVAPYIRNADYAIRPPFLLGERSLLDYIIFYVQEGRFDLQVNGQRHMVKEGDLCLLQPGDLHTIRGLDNTINPYVHLDFFYNPHRADSFVTRPGQLDMAPYASYMQPRLHDCESLRIPLKLETPHPKKMRDLVFRMIESWQLQTYLGMMEANQLAHEWVTALFKAYMTPDPGTLSVQPFLNWITSYFAFRISEPIKVEDMARRAGLSPSRFTVLFRQHFNLSPYQYLLKLRIEHAQELLKDGLSLQRVSEYCGFTDVHHFSKTFKSATGVNPGYYKRHRE